MKHFDFSFHNDSETDLAEARQRLTFNAPIDLVGKVRISRFKLTEGAFPFCKIGPSQNISMRAHLLAEPVSHDPFR